MPSRPAYSGTSRKLVLAFDVGTTYSGVSYVILDPGTVPVIHGVRRFPGQENVAGDSKIPSILYYDQDGNVCAVGAEAALPSCQLTAEDEEWNFVHWFKLHLRPRELSAGDLKTTSIPALPEGKTVVDVFGDFLAYLFKCARKYIMESHSNGESMWNSFGDRMEFVLSHPNGWEGPQQAQMRQAAVHAGLIPDNVNGHARVQFVTEGEASLHFCVDSGLIEDTIEKGKSVMIVDAGGGTVDISTYKFTDTTPLTVEEIATPDCIIQGSTRVNARAQDFLKAKLKLSRFGNEEDVKTMLESFESSAKPVFKDSTESAFIKFGRLKDKDDKVNIKNGQLILSGTEMAALFEPSVNGIMKSVTLQQQQASTTISAVFFVGGFAASPWLYSQLQEGAKRLGLNVYRPHSQTSKAVAEGAAIYYLDHNVSVRIAKVTYGTEVVMNLDETDPEHRRRQHTSFVYPSGEMVIPGAFQSILKKGSRMLHDKEISISLTQATKLTQSLDSIETSIQCYRGSYSNPGWTDIEPSMFSTLCWVRADTSNVLKDRKIGPIGFYYQQDFKVVLKCGLTELEAQISWVENGVEKRGPASIIYDNLPLVREGRQ